MKIQRPHLRALTLGTFGLAISCGAIDVGLDAGKAALGFKKRSDRGENQPHFPPSERPRAQDQSYLTMDQYQSCEDLKVDLQANLQVLLRYNWNQALHYRANQAGPGGNGTVASDTMQSPAAASAPKAPEGAKNTVGTNVQVNGVDEADDIRITENAIYISDNQLMGQNMSVAVVGIKPLLYRGAIDLGNLMTPKLFTPKDLLVVTGVQNSQSPSGYFTSQYVVKTYDMAVIQTPKLIHTIAFEARPVDSRMVDGKLVVVLKDSLKFAPNWNSYPNEGDLNGTLEQFLAKTKVDEVFAFADGKIAGIDCSAMVKFPVVGSRFEFQRVISYDVATGKVLDQTAIPGDDSALYMTESSIYTVGSAPTPLIWINPNDVNASEIWADLAQRRDKLVIKKVTFDAASGRLQAQAVGEVIGHLKQFDAQWSFNEMTSGQDKYLSVVTTTGDIRDTTGKNAAANHLTILRLQDRKLERAASLDDFGKNEDVRAVRYVGAKAYVVTFKRTDPLFAIDLSDPLAPRIEGELKIPGFSMYLQPHGADRLIGLGFEAEDSGELDINRAFFQGVLLQLFDTSNPAEPKRLFFTELGRRGSYSEANQDHHAFFYDQQENLLAFPLVTFDDGPSASGAFVRPGNGQQVHNNRTFSGAVFYKILAEKLAEVKRVSHFEMLAPICRSNLLPATSWTNPISGDPEVRRIFRIDSTIYTVSNFGVRTIDVASFADLETVRLPKVDCIRGGGNGGYE